MPSEGAVRTTIQFSRDDVVISEGKEASSVLLLRGWVPSDRPGEPALPFRRCLISLPSDATHVTAQAKAGPRVRLADHVKVAPGQPNMPTLIGARIERMDIDRRVYASDAEWPEATCRVAGVRKLGGLTIAEVDVCPFRYKPMSGTLDLVIEVELIVRFTAPETKRAEPPSLAEVRHEERIGERVRALVANAGDVRRHYRLDHGKPPADQYVYPEVPHVIITGAALAPTFERLACWRSTLGLPSRVVKIEDIIDGTVPDTRRQNFWRHRGFVDGGTRDRAEAIRAFLKWATVHWSTEYAVLGGDTDVVPCRQAIHQACSTADYSPLTSGSRRAYFNVTASSEQPDASAGNVADEDVATAWECAATDRAPWLCLDFYQRTPVNTLNLLWGAAHASSYVIEASDDGSAWTVIHRAKGASGGTETITFSPRSTRQLRIRIKSGASFSLTGVRVFGPGTVDYSGTAYAIDATTTRIYLSRYMSPIPDDSQDADMVLILDGPHRGTRIPYRRGCDAHHLGWRFVEDLIDNPGAASSEYTSYLEIRGPAEFHGQPFVLKGDLNYIATDLYFADIASSDYPARRHHDWDADDNAIFGERYGAELDRVNSIADIRVGRLPASTAAEAEVMVDKILRYETYRRRDELGIDVPLPASFATTVVLGSQNWYSPGGGGWLDGSAQGKEDIRHMLRNVDPDRWTFTRLYEDMADVPSSDQGPDLDVADTWKLLGAIRDGANVVALSSHGSPGYLCYLTDTDIDGLVNTPGIFYGNACSTNKFDQPYSDCLGEKSLLDPRGGAVAYMGNTRFGWTGDNPVELAFWTEMTQSGRLGQMLDAARLAAWDWTRYSMNLLGDPAMLVWSDRPQQLTVAHAAEILNTERQVVVTVTASGAPVTGATVCLSIPDRWSVSGQTDANGSVALAVALGKPTMMRIAASGKNLIPYLGSIVIKEGGDRVVRKSTRSIDGSASRIQRGIQLDAKEASLSADVLAVWGIPDLVEFARRLNTPAIRDVLERMPRVIGEPLRALGERIRKEEDMVD